MSSQEPTAKDFSPKAVYREVLKDTLQHPLTILPAAASAVSVMYLGVIAQEPAAFAVAFGAALLSVGSWVFNYFVRGEKLAEAHVEELQRVRKLARREERRSLEAAWSEIDHAEGEQQARELRQAYEKLKSFLESDASRSSSLQRQRLLVLAEDTFDEGLQILRVALETQRALTGVNIRKLRYELEQWQQQLVELVAPPPGADGSWRQTLEDRVAGHRQRLDLYEKRSASMEQLLAESELLEAALENTYLEAASMSNPERLFSRGHSAAALERAVGAARRVEERLTQAAGEDDDIYLAAGRQQSME